jgi:hypothetical protein
LEPDTDNLGSSFNSTISLVTSFPSRGLEKCLTNLLSTEVLDIQSLLSTTTDATLDASFLSLRRTAAAGVLRGDFTEDDLRLEVVLQSPNIWEPPILASTEEQRGNSTDDEQHTSSLLSTDICNR